MLSNTFAMLVSAWCSCALVSAQDRPLALVGMENSRASLRTGHVIWSTRCNTPRTRDDIIYHWYSHDVPRYFTSRFTPDEIMVEDNGDPRGVVWQMADGKPHPDLGYRPMRYLLYDDAQWQHRDSQLLAQAYQGYRSLPDPRTFGVTAELAPSLGLHDKLWRRALELAYETRVVDGLYEVTERTRGSEWLIRYLLDPQRGWNAVRVTVFDGTRQLYDVRSTLKQYGDAWFPERVELYEHNHRAGQEPAYVTEVLSASFNEPDHPRHLTPESIGIEVGTQIEVYPKGNLFRPVDTFGWDGKKLVPLEELFKRIRAGELQEGPRTKVEIGRSQVMAHGLEAVESEWERYVHSFIQKYRLTDDQSATADRILHDCQAEAKQYLARHKEEIEKVRQEVRELFDLSKPHAEQTDKAIPKLKERMMELEAPIRKIFYGELVPRLEKLPTREQRNAAAEREQAATKPSALPDRQP